MDCLHESVGESESLVFFRFLRNVKKLIFITHTLLLQVEVTE